MFFNGGAKVLNTIVDVRSVDTWSKFGLFKTLLDRFHFHLRKGNRIQFLVRIKDATYLITSDERLIELEARATQIESQYEEDLAAQLDPIIKEGQRLETELQEKDGKKTRKNITFKAADLTIVKNGEEVGKDHLALVQEAVKSKLEELEATAQEAKQRELERNTIETASVKAESDQAINLLRAEAEDQAAGARAELQRMRDELLDLKPLSFMGEIRFRELRSRWGQVFRADMGAEAFFGSGGLPQQRRTGD